MIRYGTRFKVELRTMPAIYKCKVGSFTAAVRTTLKQHAVRVISGYKRTRPSAYISPRDFSQTKPRDIAPKASIGIE